MAKYAINPLTGKLDRITDSVALTQNVTQASQGGYDMILAKSRKQEDEC